MPKGNRNSDEIRRVLGPAVFFLLLRRNVDIMSYQMGAFRHSMSKCLDPATAVRDTLKQIEIKR